MYINTVVENVYINTVVENVYIYIYISKGNFTLDYQYLWWAFTAQGVIFYGFKTECLLLPYL